MQSCYYESKYSECESSSVGRARPCQGRGRGFEPRLSLQEKASLLGEVIFFECRECPGGGIGRHAGLKILCPLRTYRFKSDPGYKTKALLVKAFVIYILYFLQEKVTSRSVGVR